MKAKAPAGAQGSAHSGGRPSGGSREKATESDGLEDHPDAGGLLALARLLAVSPYRLSRAFPAELGVSLTRYRNRIRVGRALDRLADGAQSLADLAADLGFDGLHWQT